MSKQNNQNKLIEISSSKKTLKAIISLHTNLPKNRKLDEK